MYRVLMSEVQWKYLIQLLWEQKSPVICLSVCTLTTTGRWEIYYTTCLRILVRMYRTRMITTYCSSSVVVQGKTYHDIHTRRPGHGPQSHAKTLLLPPRTHSLEYSFFLAPRPWNSLQQHREEYCKSLFTGVNSYYNTLSYFRCCCIKWTVRSCI